MSDYTITTAGGRTVEILPLLLCPVHGYRPHRRGQECVSCLDLLALDRTPDRTEGSEAEPWFTPEVPDSEVPF